MKIKTWIKKVWYCSTRLLLEELMGDVEAADASWLWLKEYFNKESLKRNKRSKFK